MDKRVIVGISGGVDSAVAALLLKEEGFNVECLFMKSWDENDPGYCPAEEDYKDALAVCDILNLPIHSVDFTREYWESVFQVFLEEIQSGLTPNPDILCNQEIKFRVFLDYAQQLGAARIATGHYARISRTNGHYHLQKGMDTSKDQSYFLYTLGQSELSNSLFPLGDMKKSDVRSLAQKASLPVSDKKDSTGICFIGERPFQEFLHKFISYTAGEMITTDGQVVGKHTGLPFYTLGQRKGLGIGGGYGTREAPWYVLDKVIEKNQLVVGQGRDHPGLFHRKLIATRAHWTAGEAPEFPLDVKAKIRYRAPDRVCRIELIDGEHIQVEFAEPHFAVTPGQSVVFYQGDECLGGAVIQSRSP